MASSSQGIYKPGYFFKTFAFVLLLSSVSAQTLLPKKINVDSVVKAMKIKSTRDTFLLADTLTLRVSTDSEKVRAIYYWIAQNISYDWKAFAAGTPVRFTGDEEDYCDRR